MKKYIHGFLWKSTFMVFMKKYIHGFFMKKYIHGFYEKVHSWFFIFNWTEPFGSILSNKQTNELLSKTITFLPRV